MGPTVFQFPSNGKAHCKESPILPGLRRRDSVSIPFKRESTLQEELARVNAQIAVLVSIPFKRESTLQDTITPCSQNPTHESFNSLQTGKHIASHEIELIVDSMMCFNSLQTGKHIARQQKVDDKNLYMLAFQFPSNGKAHCKL